MDELEQRACNRAYQSLRSMVAAMTPAQRIELLTAAGCDIPDYLYAQAAEESDGSLMCCGHQVPEGEHCPECGDLNWKL